MGIVFLYFLLSHDISDIKVSKLCSLLKVKHTEHLVENGL